MPVAGGRTRGLWVALAFVVLLRAPFLNQAIQGDDHIYLTEAAHALIEPLHPNNVKYVFMGDEVDLRGHSHPPGNAWPLAGLLAVSGEVQEVAFHAAYVVFSLICAWAMWSLAVRFSPHPLWATLLFLAVPAFVVNGGSLEADLPFLAFWMAAIALFCAGRRAGSAVAMAGAAMMAYQAIFLIPILAVWVWVSRPPGERARHAWPLLAPLVTLIAWQVFTRVTTGAMPASTLMGYFQTYGFQAIQRKLDSALMLAIHSWFIIFPSLVPAAAVLAWRKRHDPETQFLLAWIGLFFAGAVVVFFAGSARYLLPMAAPVALLASWLQPKWLAVGFSAQLLLSCGLAVVNYQHWDACRRFAESLRPLAQDQLAKGHRVWVDDSLGLRHYMDVQGALPLRKTQRPRPGDLIVSSELDHAVEVTTPLSVIATAEIRPDLPLRLIGLESESGYSTTRGFWPFGVSTGLIDRLTAARVMERHPTLEYLTFGTPAVTEQIVSGIDPHDRWMSKSAVVVLKNPVAPAKLQVKFYISENTPARHMTLSLDGREVAAQTYPGPGVHSLESALPLRGAGESAAVQLDVDRTFSAPGDKRLLGVVLIGVGFVR
ncbi:MAG TPA: hypothetical protein VNY05_00220 [Candidatus Acidoferrales bacterium]|nr:hypothetical protein [Candidatus Acidoferrales bacterium]